MKKPITVKPHLSVETVETRYRQAKDPVERSQWQIIWLLAQGKTTKAIREVTGYCLAWIRTIAHRYNQDGPAGIGDRDGGGIHHRALPFCSGGRSGSHQADPAGA